MPEGKRIIHATLDPADLNKNVPIDYALVGDAKLTLAALIAAVRKHVSTPRDSSEVAAEIKAIEAEWMKTWLPSSRPIRRRVTPYRVLWELAALRRQGRGDHHP